MTGRKSEIGTKKAGTKSPKSKKSIQASQTNGTESQDEHHRMIATAAYYRAEKRSFKGNNADIVQDWLEAEEEISNV
jgi:DUF2934 family protein